MILLGSIIPWIAEPFGIFLLRQFIGIGIPRDLDDAAKVDGCSFCKFIGT